ncbi:MAG: NAD(P)H-binding protein [Deltaproteobacteria bacterium]|nr:NAD(P)H-binding protein [Deltaproteobacteria bacterium]
MSRARVGIVGCGYTGERIVRALALEAAPQPVVTTRSPARAAALAALGADARVIDPLDHTALAAALRGCAFVIHSVPPGPPEEPTAAIVAALQAAEVTSCVYLGSTAVYPLEVAGECTEDTPVEPAAERGAARLAAERTLAASGLRVALLRIAAIYGPGRGLHVRLRAGAHRVAGDGGSFVSRVHVDDLAQFALAAGDGCVAAPAAGAPASTCRIFNVADALPMTARAAADLVATRLGLPPAPSVPAEAVHESLRGNRRISRARARAELGVTLHYPTFAEGLEAVLAEEAAAGAPR